MAAPNAGQHPTGLNLDRVADLEAHLAATPAIRKWRDRPVTVEGPDRGTLSDAEAAEAEQIAQDAIDAGEDPINALLDLED